MTVCASQSVQPTGAVGKDCRRSCRQEWPSINHYFMTVIARQKDMHDIYMVLRCLGLSEECLYDVSKSQVWERCQIASGHLERS